MGGISGLISLLCMITLSSLNIGDVVPSLEGTQWLKGNAPDFTKQVTVLEVWRTTCSNCRKQIPHLTALQEKYGDRLAVVAVSRDSLETMEEYIEANGDQMGFTIGKITKEIGEPYMEGVTGVPYAFLINRDGLVVWKGHPAGIDDILDKTVNGKIDIEKLKKIAGLEASLEEALETSDPDIIAPADRSLLALDPANETALDIGMRLAIYNDEPADVKEMFNNIRLDGLSAEKASSFAEKLVIESDLEYRYPEAAIRFSEYAITKEPDNDAYMDVHARVLYCLGEIDNAISWEKKAIALNPDEGDYKSNLDYYMSVSDIRSKKGYGGHAQSQGQKK